MQGHFAKFVFKYMHQLPLTLSIFVRQFVRSFSKDYGVGICLAFLKDVQKELESLETPPKQIDPRGVCCGSQVLIQQLRGLCRATVSRKIEIHGQIKWTCLFDDNCKSTSASPESGWKSTTFGVIMIFDLVHSEGLVVL